MKLAVLGGGGVRSPMLAKSIMNRAGLLGIDKVVFMDNSSEKLRIYGGLAKRIAGMIDSDISFTLTTDPVEAVKDADFIITTLRVGGDRGRTLDERIALNHGILGQETTGAGGFAMAMRSIPALLEYCKLVKQYAKPGAYIFNFTNPSGLVTQALRDEGYDNVYGICDGPSEFIKELEALIGAKHKDVSVECFGLNHLSWYRSFKVKGQEIIKELIDNPMLYKKTEMRFFDPELAKSMGMLFNGYLYYYYSREQAIANISKSGKTRGETILEINNDMHDELAGLYIEKEFDRASQIYLKYYDKREKSYMAIESGTQREEKKLEFDLGTKGEDDGGYAGVALNFIESLITGEKSEMVLSVPNNGSMEGLNDNDVIEVTCHIDKNGAKPIKVGKVDEMQMYLIRQVKLYERLAAEAIRTKNIEAARKALMVHPLVNSYTLAKQLVAEYLEAHKEYVGQWH